MARPRKDNADYFSHDNGMRNDSKIQALRNAFNNEGYAIWCMFLETLTSKNNFKIKIKKDLDWELIAGDFRITVDLAKDVLGFCSRMDLLQEKRGVYSCKNLTNRLHPMVEKREFLRKKYGSKVVSAPETPVSAPEMPQSKVKESKVNNIRTKSAKDKNMYEEPIIQLDENGEQVCVKGKKTTFGKYPALIAKYYCELVGKRSASCQLPAAKDLLQLAQEDLPDDKLEGWFKEIKGRIDATAKHYKANNVKEWNLSKVAENWSKILKW